jgi:ribonuclease HI
LDTEKLRQTLIKLNKGTHMSKKNKQQSINQYTQPFILSNPVYTAYFDGAYRSTDQGVTAAYGAIIIQEGQTIWEDSKLVYPEQGDEYQTSNNVAEYCGLIAVLEYLINLGVQHEPIMVYGDSNLVIQQMFGSWKINEGFYVPYALKAKKLCQLFSNLSGQWIPREQNTVADALSKVPLQAASIEFRFQPMRQ